MQWIEYVVLAVLWAALKVFICYSVIAELDIRHRRPNALAAGEVPDDNMQQYLADTRDANDG